MDSSLRMATRRDYHGCIKLRAEWLDRFCAAHPPAERWCPANCRVPNVEDEGLLRQHLHLPERIDLQTLAGDNDRSAVVLPGPGGIDAYLLWRVEPAERRLSIEGQTPRVSRHTQARDAADRLLAFVLRHAAKQGLTDVRMSFHGFPDEVRPLIDLYRKHGLEGDPRREMLSRQLSIDSGLGQLDFRSAEEVGLDTFHEMNAAVRRITAAASKADLAFSQKMWSVDTATDWLVAYDGQDLAGTVQVGVLREGVGVVDYIGILETYRGRGLGRCVLARGLSALVGRADVAFLDVDHDNVPAIRLYERAGFCVHHHHGQMTRTL